MSTKKRKKRRKKKRKPTSPKKKSGGRAAKAEQPCPGPCPRCTENITKAQLKKIFTSASDDKLNKMRDAFNEGFKKFDMDRCLRKAHFFAQVLKEVGASLKGTPVESMNYSEKALRSGDLFSYFGRHKKLAKLYGRNSAHKANQPQIANRAYAKRNGNGDIASGDGWRFRGHGYLQLTGRQNWKRAQKEIDKRYPGSGVDIMKRQGDILKPRGAMFSAMAFWTMNGLNQKADEGATDGHVENVTDVINRKEAQKRRNIRIKNFHKTKKVFKIDQCLRRRNSKGKCVAPSRVPPPTTGQAGPQ